MALDDRPATSRGKLLLLVLALAIASIVAAFWRDDDRSPPSADPADSAGGVASAESPVTPPRCETLGPEAEFVLGEAPAPEPDAGLDEDEMFAPFAAVLGRGALSKDGFLLGVLRDAEGGTVANLLRLGARGQSPSEVRLARSRGDMEAPVVAAHGDAVLVALLEPDAGGRTLRLARVVGDAVTWGAEIPQGMDESMAVDLAVSGNRALLAWDDVDKREHSRVVIAPFDPENVAGEVEPRPVTRPDADAETPRLFPRPGGYWLLYVVRGKLSSGGAVPEEARDEPADKDEVDEGRGGERLRYAWVEAFPLTEKGEAAGEPKRLTPAEGHAVSFDALVDGEGALQLAWRDERSPLGGSGGTVLVVRADMGGVGAPVVVVDEDVGDGVPSLLPGWIAITPLSGPMLLGRLTKEGDVDGAVSAEALLGRAQPIAAQGGLLLLGRPMGKAVRLEVVSCP